MEDNFAFDPIDYDNLIEIPMNYQHDFLSYTQKSKGYFRKELLDNNIFTTYDAIRYGYRKATSRAEKYYRGQYIKFTNNKNSNYIIAVVTKSSYLVSSITASKWSILEGWDEKYILDNPDVLSKYQFVFKFLKEVIL